MEQNEKIISLLEAIQLKPGMFVGDNSYQSVSKYLDGFLSGLCFTDDVSLPHEIMYWYMKKLNDPFNTFVSTYIKWKHKDKTDEQLISILIAVLIEYFQEQQGK